LNYYSEFCNIIEQAKLERNIGERNLPRAEAPFAKNIPLALTAAKMISAKIAAIMKTEKSPIKCPSQYISGLI
jgi:hypothetical protein